MLTERSHRGAVRLLNLCVLLSLTLKRLLPIILLNGHTGSGVSLLILHGLQFLKLVNEVVLDLLAVVHLLDPLYDDLRDLLALAVVGVGVEIIINIHIIIIYYLNYYR